MLSTLPAHQTEFDRPPSRISWLKLVARVSRIDLVSIHCNAPLKVVQVVAVPDEHADPYRPPASKVTSAQQLAVVLMPA